MNDIFDNDILNLTQAIEADAEFIPLITAEEEENMNKEKFPEDLAILPLRNNVLFPGVVIPITVGRDKSIKLIQDANKGKKSLGLFLKRIKRRNHLNFLIYIQLELLLKLFDC